MIQGSLRPQNVTVLKVTMLMMEPKIHEAKKARTAGETDEPVLTVRDVKIPARRWTEEHHRKNITAVPALIQSVEHPLQVKIPARQWTEERHSCPCSNQVCGTLHPGQDCCSVMDRRVLQSYWLYVELPTQAHRPEIDHILVHKQVLDKLRISQVLQDMFSNNNRIKFEINRTPSRKSPNI